jgi:hypothetical protein
MDNESLLALAASTDPFRQGDIVSGMRRATAEEMNADIAFGRKIELWRNDHGRDRRLHVRSENDQNLHAERNAAILTQDTLTVSSVNSTE